MVHIVGLQAIPQLIGTVDNFRWVETTNFLGRPCHELTYSFTAAGAQVNTRISVPVHRIRDIWSQFTGWIRELCGWKSAWLSIDGQEQLERVLINPKGQAVIHTAWAIEIPLLAARLIQRGSIAPHRWAFSGVFSFSNYSPKLLDLHRPMSFTFCRPSEPLATSFQRLRGKANRPCNNQTIAREFLVRISMGHLSAQALLACAEPSEDRFWPASAGSISVGEEMCRSDAIAEVQRLGMTLTFLSPVPS